MEEKEYPADEKQQDTPQEDLQEEKVNVEEDMQSAEASQSETECNKNHMPKKKLIKKENNGQKNKSARKKDELIAELNDRLMRNMAEFDNFRKRSDKEKSTMYEIGAKSIIEKILPVVDNLERGFDALSEKEKEEPFVKGIEQIYKQFMGTLEEVGVKPIEAQGKEFDPELHNAVMHDEDENFGENIVSAEMQKGYMYKDSVVRHSMVKVSN